MSRLRAGLYRIHLSHDIVPAQFELLFCTFLGVASKQFAYSSDVLPFKFLMHRHITFCICGRRSSLKVQWTVHYSFQQEILQYVTNAPKGRLN